MCINLPLRKPIAHSDQANTQVLQNLQVITLFLDMPYVCLMQLISRKAAVFSVLTEQACLLQTL